MLRVVAYFLKLNIFRYTYVYKNNQVRNFHKSNTIYLPDGSNNDDVIGLVVVSDIVAISPIR